LKLFVICLIHLLNIAPVKKTLNRHVFTILKTCFLDLSIPFPLNLARFFANLQIFQILAEEIEGGRLVHLQVITDSHTQELRITD
jgi:hypothetical protein